MRSKIKKTKPVTILFYVAAILLFFTSNAAAKDEGYKRDAYGNYYQVTFDLRDRFHLGMKWIPYLDQGGSSETGRVAFDFGFHSFIHKSYSKTRHRYRLFFGEVALNPAQVDFTLLAYDQSNINDKPLLWITTFWGKPKRHNIFMNAGWGFSLVNIKYRPMLSMDYTLVDFFSFFLSWDIWNSFDLMNFVRLKSGAGIHGLHHKSGDYGWHHTITWKSSLEGRFVLDDSGLHHLSFTIDATLPNHLDEKQRNSDWQFYARLAYEHAFIAISDQPLSLYFEVTGQYRKDIPNAPHTTEMRLGTGLRFSFWAPTLKREGRPQQKKVKSDREK